MASPEILILVIQVRVLCAQRPAENLRHLAVTARLPISVIIGTEGLPSARQAVLKTVGCESLGGSNPSPSALFHRGLDAEVAKLFCKEFVVGPIPTWSTAP